MLCIGKKVNFIVLLNVWLLIYPVLLIFYNGVYYYPKNPSQEQTGMLPKISLPM